MMTEFITTKSNERGPHDLGTAVARLVLDALMIIAGRGVASSLCHGNQDEQNDDFDDLIEAFDQASILALEGDLAIMGVVLNTIGTFREIDDDIKDTIDRALECAGIEPSWAEIRPIPYYER